MVATSIRWDGVRAVTTPLPACCPARAHLLINRAAGTGNSNHLANFDGAGGITTALAKADAQGGFHNDHAVGYADSADTNVSAPPTAGTLNAVGSDTASSRCRWWWRHDPGCP